MHYLDFGGPSDAPLLVCVHGLGGSALNWAAVAPTLAQTCRVVAIDLPQVVDLVSNPQGFELLHRDCVNVCDWFTRQRLECDAEELFGELVGEVGF